MVSDSYSDSYVELNYSVILDNNFSAYAWKDESDNTYTYKSEYVVPKKSLTLKPVVYASDPSGVKYEWKETK